ncbi:hypothetical protein HXX76_012467 [Chlamydomonas incerta]|uniref:Uncharacterized protein n=1 Tax=Chlamydomonas incerta TaxID=51695 RepID=A0A835VW30_CHLIN|nr:hypothetical protein HXX76_012467 [Chlamydomonas incerta]|eukprot:KAG2427271.1 hypothetical protein HXX76_012467 [Chlamydomonas incerta]
MVEGLSRLQQLQRLSLVCSALTGHEARAHALLGARRPPHVRSISIYNGAAFPRDHRPLSLSLSQALTFQLEYGPLPPQGRLRACAPGAAAACTAAVAEAAAASAAASRPAEGILRVTVGEGLKGCYHTKLMARMEAMAAHVLGTAATLRQRRIPQLVFQDLYTEDWEPPEPGGPGAPLLRLLRRCRRVDLGRLTVSLKQDPGVPAAALRLFGLPRELALCHHTWRRREDTLAALAVMPRRRRPTLTLDTRNPTEMREAATQVVQDAASELWTEAGNGLARGAASSIGANGGSRSSGGGSQGSSSGQRGSAIVLLHGPLPGSGLATGCLALEEEWLQDALHQWFGGQRRQQQQGVRRFRELLELLGRTAAVAAPAADMVLVECRSSADAAEVVALVARLGKVMVARGGDGGGESAPVRAAVLPAALPGVTEGVQHVWQSAVSEAILATVRRSAPAPVHAVGTAAHAAAGPHSAAAGAGAARARIDDTLLGRLDALMSLDVAAWRLWQLDEYCNVDTWGLDSKLDAEEMEERVEAQLQALLGRPKQEMDVGQGFDD